GYWTEVFGTSNRLVYMLGYPSLGDREKSWAAFQADPAWQQARAASEQNGPLVAKVSSCILRPTPYSPKG
ncbi:MAG: NIPSNAP family protein, partial [Candidatus Binatia bacterium]